MRLFRLPRFVSYGILTLAILGGIVLYIGAHAAALSDSGCQAAGSAFPTCYKGYFFGSSSNQGFGCTPADSGQVIPSGLEYTVTNDVVNVSSLIQGIKDNYNQVNVCNGDGGIQGRVGAAMIIESMLGRAPDGGVAQVDTAAQADMATWEDRINQYAAAGQIHYEPAFQYCINTFYMSPAKVGNGTGVLGDVATYDSCAADGGQQQSSGVIVFTDAAGNVLYGIKTFCGNPVGALKKLPPLTPQLITSCGNLSVSPLNPELNVPVSLKGSIEYSGGSPDPQNVDNLAMTIKRKDGTLITPPVVNGHGGSSPALVTANNVQFTQTGHYTVTWTATINGVVVNCGDGISPGVNSFEVSALPYFSVSGGDVIAGSDFASPGNPAPCTSGANKDAGVVSWNKGQPAYNGAGSEYAAMAMNQLQDFATSHDPASPSSAPSVLAFANDASAGVDKTQGLFGGMFNDAPCVKYWQGKPTDALDITTGTTSVNGLDGVYQFNAKSTDPADQMVINDKGGNNVIGDGKHVTIYVKGNVSITSNITYDRGSSDLPWNGAGDIPSFKLIVDGNIYIGKDVTQLDGLYVALPDNDAAKTTNTSGVMVTCSDPDNPYSAMDWKAAATNGFYLTCAHQLTFNGAVAANQLWLLRTAGTLSSNIPAEIINYTPEMWLSTDGGATYSSSLYDSVTSLPPVL